MAIANVIQFEGDPDALVWKSPVEDFNTASQLIVDPTHEAIVVVEGHPEVYGEGRHTIETQNYFGLNAIQRMATGGETPFPCQVYFVNKVHAMDMKWGTSEKIAIEDLRFHIDVHLGTRGSLSYTVTDSRKFIEKLTGYRREFRPEEAVEKFRGKISSEVCYCVANCLPEMRLDYTKLAAATKDIEQRLFPTIAKFFEEYGIKLVFFNIEAIHPEESDLAELQKRKQDNAITIMKAQADAQARAIQGYTWQDEKKADILQALGGNEGAAGATMGMGIGMMSVGPMGGNLTQMADDFFAPNPPASNAANPFGNTGVSGAAPTAAPGGPQPFGVQEAAPTQQAQQFSGQPAAPMQPPTAQPSQTVPASASAPAAGATCPNPACGQSVQPGWKMCPFCGIQLGNPKCPNPACGQEVQPGWKMCPFCGQSL